MTAAATILGISAHFHDAACCIIHGGKLITAIQEERLTRIKHDPATPIRAYRACLAQAELDVTDIDCVGYYESPTLKAKRIAASKAAAWTRPRAHASIDPLTCLRRRLGYDGEIKCFPHHMSHAASAFYPSGFESAAILTVDGVGEWTTTAYWHARPAGLVLLEEVRYPHSLGLLYSAFTAYLGFPVNNSEYKVMGLAAYGKPGLVEKLNPLVSSTGKGQYRLDMRYFDFMSGERMYSNALENLLGRRAREPGEPLEEFHADVACSIQALLEEILLEKVCYLHERVPSDRLCLAGGVALNSVANGRIHREGPFEEVFVQPAAGDAGGALGAAALTHKTLNPETPLDLDLRQGSLGLAYSRDTIRALLSSTAIRYQEFPKDGEELFARTAAHLAGGRVIGWFQGKMEFGPRALGARSILADPRLAHMRDRINAEIKWREPFRPFAPAVLADRASLFFDLPYDSPFMLETCAVRSSTALPATTHVDGSARVQTVDPASREPFARLLRAFDRLTGCPILLNTSFNMMDEPIVCTPEDALVCFMRSELEVLVLDSFMIDRNDLPARLVETVRRCYVAKPVAVSQHTYTLV